MGWNYENFCQWGQKLSKAVLWKNCSVFGIDPLMLRGRVQINGPQGEVEGRVSLVNVSSARGKKAVTMTASFGFDSFIKPMPGQQVLNLKTD